MGRRGKKKGARDEDSNVNADDIPADSRKIVQSLKEIIYCSEQEIYKVLVECRMDANEAINRLLSQDTFQEVKSKGDKEKEISQTKDTSDSCSQEVDSSIQNGEFSNGDDCGGNKFNSDETSNVQGTHNHLAGSSTTAGILGPYKSDLTNGETKIVPISSAEAVPPISLPSSSDLTNVETKRVPISSRKAVHSLSRRPSRLISATSGQRTMADVVKMSLGLSKESVTKAPLKEDFPLHEKSDVPYPFSNSLNESAATRDQLQESASVSNQNLHDDDVTNPFVNSFIDSAARSDQIQESASVSNQNLRDDDVTNPFSNSLNESAARSDQIQESASVSNQNLRDDDVTNPFSNSFIDSATRSDQIQESASVSNQKLRDDHVTYPFSNSYAATRDQLQESASVFNQNLLDNNLSYFSKSFIESAARRDQLPESASVSNQNLRNDDVTYPFSNSFIESFELNRTKDLPASVVTCLQQLSIEIDEPKASVKDDEPNHQQVKTSELPHLIFGRFGSGMNGSGQPSSFPSQSLNDDSEDTLDFADDLSLKYLITRDDEPYEEEEQRQRRNVANEQMTEQVRYETAQENQYRSSSSATFTFDNSQRLNPALAPSEPSLQMQNFNTFPDVMHQQAYIREPDSLFSAYPFNQPMPTKHSITTASSLGRRPSVSMTEALKPATIFEPQNHHYSQPEVPSGHYGNMMNPPCSLPNQNDSYNFSPSAFQQHSGSNNSTYHHQSLASMLPQYRNSNLPQSVVPVVPSAYGFGSNNNTYHHQSLASMLPQYRNSNLPQSAVPIVPSANGPAYGSAYGSAYGFGTLSDNAANSGFDYGGVLSSLMNGSNHLPSIQHQSANSNVWPPQRQNDSLVHLGSDYHSLISGHQNQQSRNFRHIQQEQEQLYRDLGHERSNPYFLSLDQHDPRSDSSKQIQHRLWPKDKY